MCDRFPGKFDVQTSYKPSNYVLGLIFVVNIKFLAGTYQQQKNSIVRVTGLDVNIYINVSVPHQNILCNKSKTHNTKFGVMGDTYPAVGVTSD